MKMLAKFFLWLLGVAIPVMIAACYGAPFSYSKNGRVIDSETKDGIVGIKITCLENGNDWNTTYATSDGYFYLYYDIPCDSLRFEDEDGEDNGGLYQPRTIPFDPDCEELTVELHR